MLAESSWKLGRKIIKFIVQYSPRLRGRGHFPNPSVHVSLTVCSFPTNVTISLFMYSKLIFQCRVTPLLPPAFVWFTRE